MVKIVIIGSIAILLISLSIAAYQKGYLSFNNRLLQPSPSSTLTFAPAPSLPTDFDAKLQDGPFACPLSSTFCQDKSAYRETNFTAKFNTPQTIYAAFDGIAEGLLSNHPLADGKNEEFIQVILTNERRGLQSYYSFKGNSPGKIVVRQGDVIATSSGMPINFLQDNSLIVDISKLSPDGYTPIKMIKGIFKP